MSFYMFHGYKCIANDMYQSIKCRPKPRSFAIPTKSSSLGARLSVIHYAHLQRVGFCSMPPSAPVDTFGVNPIPIFTWSSPLAHSLCSITNCRLSLDAGGSPPIDLYHIITMHRMIQHNRIIQKIAQ